MASCSCRPTPPRAYPSQGSELSRPESTAGPGYRGLAGPAAPSEVAVAGA
jgi:hypothetical protein